MSRPSSDVDESRATARIRTWSAAQSYVPALAIVAAQQILFPAPAGIVVRGLVVGGLTALVALGMALVYRANRIINFAQADLGFAPAIVAFLLIDESGWPYPVAVAVGLALAVGLGATTERLVIRRFFRAPRLLVTIATIGLSQVLAAGALLVPGWWDVGTLAGAVAPPFDATATLGGLIFDANDLLALVATPVAVALVVVFLRRSDTGVAIRASADGADRAALLGVPVARLQTIVWSTAGALAFVAVFLRSSVLQLPTETALGFSVLLRALVALLLGRMTNLVGVTTAAVALGALELGIQWNHGFELIDPVLGVVLVVALLARRRETAQMVDVEAAAWRAAGALRPLPAALARIPVVRVARLAVPALVVAGALVLPVVLDTAQVFKASALLIYAVLGLSLVVLSGWAGAVSLGQVAFFAVGAAVAGAAVTSWDVDLLVALVLAALAGAAVAALVGVPALRLRGLYLAVTTFAFALATTSYLLDDSTFSWVPGGGERIERAPLLGGIAVTSEVQVYYLALAVLVATMLAMAGVRSSRFGRVLLALRDNERAAQAYAVDAARVRLAAFALAGAVAALAGGLFVHHERAFDSASYSPLENLAVFTMVVVGGMSSIAGALLGALFLLGARWFLDPAWQFLATGIGVLLVLLVAPGGLASLLHRGRDRWLRRVADRHRLDVPGFTAAPGTAVRADVPNAADADADASPAGDASRRSGTGARGADEGGADEALLAVRDVEVGYGGVPVLFGVDLDVREGEAVALLGTNGAGKSTLLRAVSGLAPPNAGRVVFDGTDVTGMPPHAVAALGIGQMPGGAGVFPTLSVADNLRVAAWLHRRDRTGVTETTARLAALFPVLQERSDEQAATLSGGQQQMLALAMAVLARPRLLMIDELSLGLAPAVVAHLLRFVDELRARGTTLVVVEQSVNVALEIADRAVFLERGEVRYVGPSAGLLDRPDLLRSVFLGAADAPAPTPGAGSGRAAAGAGDGGAVSAAGAPGDVVGTRALEVTGATVSFGGIRAVQDVSLAVAPGEIVGVVGPNGAGKTTLFDALSGFVALSAGRVRLAGRDVTALRAPTRARRGLGRSFQDARLFGSLTVDETIAVALERWVAVGDPLSAALHLPTVVDSEHAVARRVDALVSLLGLEPYRSLFVGELSTGTRRVVDLACLLAHKPRVVLLDEPASGIAQREVEQLAPLIRRIRDETGAAVIVIDHDIPLVEQVADRLVAMDQGQVVVTGSPAEVLADPAVLRSYLGDDQSAIRRSGARTAPTTDDPTMRR